MKFGYAYQTRALRVRLRGSPLLWCVGDERYLGSTPRLTTSKAYSSGGRTSVSKTECLGFKSSCAWVWMRRLRWRARTGIDVFHSAWFHRPVVKSRPSQGWNLGSSPNGTSNTALHKKLWEQHKRRNPPARVPLLWRRIVARSTRDEVEAE